MQTISVIGGSGELGGGLAMRWARAGLPSSSAHVTPTGPECGRET